MEREIQMATTFGNLKDFVLDLLQKNVGYQGFYTDTKLKNAVQESLDFIAIDMGIAGEGWLKTITPIDYPTAGVKSIALPSDCMFLEEVRWLVGDTYVPLPYDSAQAYNQNGPTAGNTQTPSRYRLVGMNLYFDPPSDTTGDDLIQLEYIRYPAVYATDATTVDADFSRAMFWYLRYKAASVLVAQNGRQNPPWAPIEIDWYRQFIKACDKRVKSTQYVRDFMP
jgi:hypothetical protein